MSMEPAVRVINTRFLVPGLKTAKNLPATGCLMALMDPENIIMFPAPKRQLIAKISQDMWQSAT